MQIHYKGGSYDGDLLDGIPHGKGTFSCTDYQYNGDFYKGKFHGRGELHAEESWSNEPETYLFDRQGNRLFWGGIDYEGEFADGVPNGYGVMSNADYFECYEGDLKDAVPDGKGICHFYDGSIYEGDWKLGKADGYGRYQLSDGTEYTGNWKADILNIETGYLSINGDRYTGPLVNGVPYGQGTLITKNKRVIYTGEFKNGMYSGHGTCICYHTQDTVDYIYTGEFSNGKYHGIGTYQQKWFGWTYEGSWENGSYSNGKFTYKDGSYYIGAYKRGCRHGQGKYVFSDGVIVKGLWDSKQNICTGTLTHPDGSSKTGWLMLNDRTYNKQITRASLEDVFIIDCH